MVIKANQSNFLKRVFSKTEEESDLSGYFKVRRDVYGYAESITCDDFVVLHLVPGSKRNQRYSEEIINLLNKTKTKEE